MIAPMINNRIITKREIKIIVLRLLENKLLRKLPMVPAARMEKILPPPLSDAIIRSIARNAITNKINPNRIPMEKVASKLRK